MDGHLDLPDARGARAARAVISANPSKLVEVTLSERLWLWRTATRPRVSLLDAAERFGLDVSLYWAVETGYERLSEAAIAKATDTVKRGLCRLTEPVMTVPLACRLARRRSRLRLAEVVVALGLGSRPTFYKLEAAGDPRIVSFWEERGFSFNEVGAETIA